MAAGFSELSSAGLMSFGGPDAVVFLHAQLTSDVAGLPSLRTQYSAYCSPKGRVLAVFLLWRSEDEVLLQLPESLREALQAKLSRYVLRAQVKIAAETSTYRIFGAWGPSIRDGIVKIAGTVPAEVSEFVFVRGIRVARLEGDRFIVVSPASEEAHVRSALAGCASEEAESAWSLREVRAGVPIVTRETQDEFVPQMLNLDLIGGVSYTKGCYPGQEIVARTRYLGRLKQRTYRIHVAAGVPPQPADKLYSAAFGPEQASGAVLYAAPAPEGGYEALAVVQTNAARPGELKWKSLDGPAVELKPLPYSVAA
jgi:folate-binding protein YgfZ